MAKEILIVDDDPVVQHILSSIVKKEGYEVQIVDSGTRCLETLREFASSSKWPGALFLDLQLMDMTGAEVLEQLRTLPGGDELPVVILTSHQEHEVKDMYPDLVANFFLGKPFKPEKVAEVLQALFSE